MKAKQPPSKGKRRKNIYIYEQKKEKKGTKMMKI
jgi:hypothetical protein